MFALFEAGLQQNHTGNNPQVASLRSLPGANHVAPLRGATGLTGHVALSLNKYKKNTNSKEFVFF